MQTWAAVNVFCICTLIFAAIEAGLMANGKCPLLFSKSAWARSSSKWQSWGLTFIWAYVLQVAAITICNFSYAMEKWDIVVPAIASLMLEVGVIALIKLGKRKMGIYPRKYRIFK